MVYFLGMPCHLWIHYYLFPKLDAFNFIFLLNCFGWNSSTRLNKSDESRYPCFALDPKGKIFSFHL
jgi:hypothetical protein